MEVAPKRVVRRFIRSLGLDVVRYGPERFPNLRRLQIIRERNIGLVLDVGANVGQWGGRLRADGYRGRLVSFEPLPDAFAVLERLIASDPLWEAHRVALGDADGTATMGVAGNSWSSSLLPMEALHLKSAPESAYERAEEVVVRRLDALNPSIVKPDDRMFIKVDVQGFELATLRGADEVLRQAEALEVELSLAPLYTGQALLPEVVLFLHTAGLSLVGLEPAFIDPATGDPLQVNGLFIRRLTA
jgi:FkbM family methyltransferase